MAEIASAWVSLLPSASGFGAATSKAIGPQMNSAGKSAGGILGKAIGVAAGAAVLAAGLGKGLYEIGQTFDDMNDTIVVGTGASGKALAGLEQVAKNIGKNTPSSFADIGTAVAGLNQRLDLTGKPLQNMATKVLNLSRITGTDLGGNIADMSRVFGDWGISMKDQPAALDKIFYASQATGTGINSLAQSVVQMGAPLRQFGFSFEESLAMFGKWEKEGVNTTAVMSGLKIGLGKFSKAGEDPKKALADVEAAIKGAGSAGEANAIAIEAFGQRAGPDMAAAVREGRFELGSLVKGIQGSGGSIAKADKGTRDFAETWQVFKNNVLLKLEPIATRVFSGFSDFAASNLPKLISGFDSVSAGVSSFVADFKAGVGVAGQFSTAFSAVSTVLLTLGNFMLNNKATVGAFAGVILTVVAAVKVWTIAQGLLNLVLTANPIGLLVVAIAALVAGVVYAYTHFETFRNVVDAVFGFLKTVVTAVISFVADHWQLIVSIIGGPLVAIGILVVQHWGAIKSFVMGAVNAVINFVRDHWRTIITIIGGPLGLAVALVTKYWSQIKAATTAVWNAIKSVISAQINAAKAVVSTAIGAIKSNFNNIADLVGKVRGWFGEIVSVVKKKLGEVVSFVKGVPDKIKSALGNVGTLLYNAGVQIIEGLWSGLKDKWEDVKGWFGDVTSSIPSLKGPPKKDKTLLNSAGKLIIQGLIDGLVSAETGVVANLKGLTTAIEKGVVDGLTSMRDKTKGILDGLKSDFASMRDSIASTFTGDLFSFSDIKSDLNLLPDNFAELAPEVQKRWQLAQDRLQQAASKSALDQFTQNLTGVKSNLKNLMGAFKKLSGWGVPAAFLSQLFASGNGGLILELAGSSKQTALRDAQLFGQVNSLSNQLGGQVARNDIGPRIDKTNQKLDRIEKAIDRLPKGFGREINHAATAGHKGRAA